MPLLALAASVGSGAPARAQVAEVDAAAPRPPGLDLPVVQDTLDNGLQLVVLPRPGAPTVSLVVRFGVGGMHETPGSTGIVHLLEHMLFKGSTRVGTLDPRAERPLLAATDAAHDSLLAILDRRRAAREETVQRPPETDTLLATEVRRLDARIDALEDSARAFVVANEFDRILSGWGARGLNATTSNEATTYFVELPANRLEGWFALEADRWLDPVFREFHTERDVVMEERRLRVDTSPGGLLYEAHLAAAWDDHPYRQPVIGTMADLRRLTRAEVRAYRERYYGARNAVVAIVGAVEPEEALRLAERWFGPVPAGDPPPALTPPPPPTDGPRRVEVEWDASPLLRVGWHVPSADHPDAPALQLLAALLTGGRTSVLFRSLVEGSGVATGVLASLGPGESLDRLLSIDLTPREPATIEEAEAALLDAIDRAIEEGIDPEALERVQAQLAASEVRRLRSSFGLALQLAEATARFGDWREGFRSTARLRAVGPEEIRAAAARWLTPSGRVTAVLRRPGEAR